MELANQIICPKCGGAMEQGILKPSSYPHELLWVEGPPRTNWIAGIDAPSKRVFVTSCRCTRCGYLELYAKEQP